MGTKANARLWVLKILHLTIDYSDRKKIINWASKAFSNLISISNLMVNLLFVCPSVCYLELRFHGYLFLSDYNLTIKLVLKLLIYFYC